MAELAPPPDLEGLAGFVEREDRRSALFFVGRTDIIAAVERLCAEALVCHARGAALEGATRLVQGAPGVGKTSLLSELARRWGAGPGARPVAVFVDFHELADERIVAEVIAEAVGPGTEREYRLTRSHAASVRAGVPGVASGSGTRSRSIAPAPPSFRDLQRRFPPDFWKRPVCLMVDEVQKTKPAAEAVLNALHQGRPGLPIVPLLVGLGDSQDVLQGRIGISRLSSGAVHSIGALAPEEACEAVERMLAAYRVDRSGCGIDWPARLADCSDCWPQHLHNAMRALAHGLLQVEGRLADVDADAVADREREMRENAYLARISPEIRQARRLTAAVLVDLPESGATWEEVRNAITRLRRPDLPDIEWDLPEDMDAGAFAGHLVHRGALQRQPGGSDLYRCPIPSLRNYLIEYGTRDPHGLEAGAPGEEE